MSQSGGMGPVDIANLALIKLGANTIASFGDPTRQARLVQTWFRPALRSMLRAHPWSFARVWYALNQSNFVPLQVAMGPDPEYQSEIIYTGAYTIPPDCVRLFRVAPWQYHYRVVGRLLYTDAPSPAITPAAFVGAQPGVGLPPLNSTINPNLVAAEYISHSAPMSDFDPMFIEALACKIAMHLAFPLTGNMGLQQSLMVQVKEFTQEAWYADGAEQWNDALYDNILTDVRNQISGLGGNLYG